MSGGGVQVVPVGVPNVAMTNAHATAVHGVVGDAAAVARPQQQANSQKWIWITLALLLGVIVVVLLLWWWFSSRGRPCVTDAECAYLCENAQYPCSAVCRNGGCQSYAMSCLGPDQRWCPAARACYDTRTQRCTDSGISPININAPSVAPASGASAAVGSGTAAAAAGYGVQPYGIDAPTANYVSATVGDVRSWKPFGRDEWWTRRGGKTYRLDSNRNLLMKDSQGNWWKKGTADTWWLWDRDGSILRKDSAGNMWKRDTRRQSWFKRGGPSGWERVTDSTVDLSLDTNAASVDVERARRSVWAVYPQGSPLPDADGQTSSHWGTSSSGESGCGFAATVDVYGQTFRLNQPFSVDNGRLPSMIDQGAACCGNSSGGRVASNISAEGTDPQMLGKGTSLKKFYPVC